MHGSPCTLSHRLIHIRPSQGVRTASSSAALRMWKCEGSCGFRVDSHCTQRKKDKHPQCGFHSLIDCESIIRSLYADGFGGGPTLSVVLDCFRLLQRQLGRSGWIKNGSSIKLPSVVSFHWKKFSLAKGITDSRHCLFTNECDVCWSSRLLLHGVIRSVLLALLG